MKSVAITLVPFLVTSARTGKATPVAVDGRSLKAATKANALVLKGAARAVDDDLGYYVNGKPVQKAARVAVADEDHILRAIREARNG